MPWLVLALGLITTAGISEQTRRFGIQEHQRIESTLLDNLIDTLRSKLEIDITMLTAVVGFFNASTEVKRGEFRTFYERLDLTRQLVGV